MLRSPVLATAVGLALVLAMQQSAEAQMLFSGNYVRSTATATLNWAYNRPTVSPYVNLTRRDNISNGAMNYQRLVRPQLEARRRTQMQEAYQRRSQMQQAVAALRSQMAMGTATAARDPRQQGPMPTGHITESMSYLHFYPQLQPGRRR
jgi:hypothetical protein